MEAWAIALCVWAVSFGCTITVIAFVVRDTILRMRRNELKEELSQMRERTQVVADNLEVLRKEIKDVARETKNAINMRRA